MVPLIFHHIGYATDDLAETIAAFEKLGYQAGAVCPDPVQRTDICLLTKSGSPDIEVVAPADETSSINKLVKKHGVTPYHICFETPDIDLAFEEMTKDGFIPLFRPVEAAAFGDRRICYFYKKETGYLELVES